VARDGDGRQRVAPQLADPAVPRPRRGILRETGLEPQRLCLEVTESTLIADPENARRALLALKQLGIRLAIDDFGVGQSSLGQLRTILPIDTLKIDRSFVDGLGRSTRGHRDLRRGRAARAVARRARARRGRRDAGAGPRAARMACTIAQGYHFARPLGPDEVARLLAAPVDLAA
jgi:EAL domain-containing protein (putative c-di-GMP-specific phosphodiesterase class I)